MPRKQYTPTFIRQWRAHRGHTLEHLAGMVGTTHATLSRVERGLHPYNQEMLELLADALRTDPASLIMRDPTRPEALWSLWDRAKPAERDQISALAEAVLAFQHKDAANG
jgi:transcriptional regulator with XRE-family HTH domain